MRFHPVITIFLGLLLVFVLHLVVQSLFVYGWIDGLVEVLSYMFGGFIAVFYARERNIQYALYQGIFIMLILVLLALRTPSNVSTISIFYYTVYVILLSTFGGMIALMGDKNYNGFSPLLAIIGGSVIGYSCIVLLTSIIDFNLDPNLSLQLDFFVIGIVSFGIGGFSFAFLAKEKKLQYGIYTGIIITILGLLGLQPSIIYKLPIMHLGALAIYIISAVIGSYLAIRVTKSLKQNT